MTVHVIEYGDFEIRVGIFEVLPGKGYVGMTRVVRRAGDASFEHLLPGVCGSDSGFFEREADALANSLAQGRAWVDRKLRLLGWLERFGPGGAGGAEPPEGAS